MAATTANPTARRVRHRPSRLARRLGYTVAIVVNSAMFWAVNVTPGWAAVPFLTEEASLVLGLVNSTFAVALVANAVYIVSDPQWLRHIGDVAQNIVGAVALVRIWQVFPFDFGGSAFDWALLARWVLAVGIVGTAIALAAGLFSLVRAWSRGASSR